MRSSPIRDECSTLSGCDLIACPSAQAGRITGAHGATPRSVRNPNPTGCGFVSLASVPRAGRENNTYLAFANVIDPANEFYGASGVFGPDTFEFPRRESQVLDGEGIASAIIDTTNTHDVYPTNVARRKDLVLMRLPNHYQPLVIGSRANTATGSANVELLSAARAAQAR